MKTVSVEGIRSRAKDLGYSFPENPHWPFTAYDPACVSPRGDIVSFSMVPGMLQNGEFSEVSDGSECDSPAEILKAAKHGIVFLLACAEQRGVALDDLKPFELQIHLSATKISTASSAADAISHFVLQLFDAENSRCKGVRKVTEVTGPYLVQIGLTLQRPIHSITEDPEALAY